MAGITATGVGSGLDIEGIVNSLMALERRPLYALQKQESEAKTQLSAFGKLKSALSDFQTAMDNLSAVSKFQVFSATSSDESVFTASANSSAVAGTYAIQFDSNAAPTVHQLATAHKISTTQFTNSATSIGAAGTLEITVGTAAFQINVDGSNDTLDGLKDAINNASDNTGVTATVINVDSGSKLVLTSDETGSSNGITLTAGTVTTALNITQITAAQDAVFSIDGDVNTVTSASNTIVNAIDGVTINLLAPSTGDVTKTLTITHNTTEVEKSVQAFVDTYNKLKSTLTSLQTGDLQGDSTIRSIESQIRSVINTSPSGIISNYSHLSEIGITTLKSGELTLDKTKLQTALSSDYSGVAQLFANDGEGYAFRLSALVKNYTAFDGLIDNREDGINSRIDSISDRQDNMEYRLGLIEQRFRSQFSALDSLMSQLNSTSSFLSSQLANLPSINR